MQIYFSFIFISVCPLGVFLENVSRTQKLINTVTSNGYPIETHQIETEDDYILTAFRIPHGRNTTSSNNLPIILNHGMLGSADNYIWLGPQRSLAYILADAGYDVWLMNCRGTSYSRKHKSLSPNEKQFWDFSFHEIGVYDIPAVIDYILNATHQSSLYYVGHSQGCTTVFVMGSERPEYNEKIKLAIALAPGAIYKNFNEPWVLWLLKHIPIQEVQMLADELRLYQIPPPYFSEDDVADMATMFCVENKFLKKTCKINMELATRSKVDSVEEEDIPSILSTLVNTISVKQGFHYGQLILSGNFQNYDYGPTTNQEKYNSSSPPLYNFQNITYATALFSGKTDNLVTPQDARLLAKQLPNLVHYSSVPLPQFSHVDFIISKNSKNLIYKPILKLLDRFKNK
ncbi:lipase 3-like [Diabrotica virgifera virgifera]|uniref:Lipase n=1 Tax=Diabrotica virgifera virgifera TaxID=50390 RepID=A0A6P7FUC3_DIAVI|nr:lipase 3-like [Diabrotica virgifera virgifera]